MSMPDEGASIAGVTDAVVDIGMACIAGTGTADAPPTELMPADRRAMGDRYEAPALSGTLFATVPLPLAMERTAL